MGGVDYFRVFGDDKRGSRARGIGLIAPSDFVAVPLRGAALGAHFRRSIDIKFIGRIRKNH